MSSKQWFRIVTSRSYFSEDVEDTSSLFSSRDTSFWPSAAGQKKQGVELKLDERTTESRCDFDDESGGPVFSANQRFRSKSQRRARLLV